MNTIARVPESMSPDAEPRVAFLFTGQGSQYPGMARSLYSASPAAREVLDECDSAFGERYGKSLLSVLLTDDGNEQAIHDTVWTQPGLYALELAVARTWIACGVTPSAVLGHSIGEFAAACVAGALTTRDGLVLAAERGRMMQELPRDGGMLAVRAKLAVVEARLSRYLELDIAAMNGPAAIVVSGCREQLAALERELAEEGIACTRLNVSHPFHSRRMQPMQPEFRAFVAKQPALAPRVTFASTLRGRVLAPDEALDVEYWTEHITAPVRFTDAIRALGELAIPYWVEVGPDATLLAAARKTTRTGYRGMASLKQGVAAEESMALVADMLREGGLDIAFGEPKSRPRLHVVGSHGHAPAERAGGAE